MLMVSATLKTSFKINSMLNLNNNDNENSFLKSDQNIDITC